MDKELLEAISEMFEKKVQEVKNEVIDTKRYMGVIAEGLRSDIKAVAEGHYGIAQKLDNIDKKVEILDAKIDNTRLEIKADIKGVSSEVKGLKGGYRKYTEECWKF